MMDGTYTLPGTTPYIIGRARRLDLSSDMEGSDKARERAQRLARKIIRLRDLKGFRSQYALAHAAGVSIGYVAKLERGDALNPATHQLALVASTLGTTTQALLGEDEADFMQRVESEVAQESVTSLVQRVLARIADEGTELHVTKRSAQWVEQIIRILPTLPLDQQENIVGLITGLARQSPTPTLTAEQETNAERHS